MLDRWLIALLLGVVALFWGIGASPTPEDAKSPAAPAAAPALSPVVVEAVIPAPRAEVWTAWTSDAGLQTWMAPGTNMKLEIGGPFEIFFMPTAPPGSRGADGCKVLSNLPQEMLSYTWNAPPSLPFARQHYTWVVVQFTDADAKSCRVRLTHLGFAEKAAEFVDHADEFAKTRGYFERAWTQKLADLKQRFETGPLKFES